MSKMFGVDVSEFQAKIDYSKAKKDGGVEFAVVRIGYGRDFAQKDECFDKHYDGFRSVGVPVGAYQYSYALDVEGAKREADVCLRWLDKRSLNLPVYLDMEERNQYNLGKTKVMEIAKAWCDAIRAGGYRPGVYASTSWWNHVLDKETIGASIWVADWGTKEPAPCDLWQFGGGSTNLIRSKTVAGITGNVDQNYLLKSSLINGTESGSGNKDKAEPAKPKTEAKTVTVTLKVLKKGSEGSQVRTVQRLIVANGFSVGRAGCDGIYGPDTETAVKAYQRSAKLTQDGIVAAKTWKKLLGV